MAGRYHLWREGGEGEHLGGGGEASEPGAEGWQVPRKLRMYLNAQCGSRAPGNDASVTCSDSEQIFSLVSLLQGGGRAQLPRSHVQ